MEARLKEKQALSEVIRIGLNRAQDLELICQVGLLQGLLMFRT